MWGNEKFLGPVLQKHLCRHDFHRLAFPNRFLPEITKTRAFPFNHVVDHVFFFVKTCSRVCSQTDRKKVSKKGSDRVLEVFSNPRFRHHRNPNSAEIVRPDNTNTDNPNNAEIVSPDNTNTDNQ